MLTISAIRNSAIVGHAFVPLPFKRITRMEQAGYDHVYTDADKPYAPAKVQSVMAHLKKFTKQQSATDVMRIEYTRKGGIDRAVAKGAVSCGDLYKPVRYALFGDTMIEYDLACAQQRLMISALRQNGTNVEVEFPKTLHYVNHKQAERERIAIEYFGAINAETLAYAKLIYMRLTFLGSVKSAWEYYGITREHDTTLIAYRAEMEHFADIIEANNLVQAAAIRKKTTAENTKARIAATDGHVPIVKNYKSVLATLWGRNAESTVMDALIGWCITEGIILERRFDNSKDGVMIPVVDIAKYTDTHPGVDIPAVFSAAVMELTGYDAVFEATDMITPHHTFWAHIAVLEAERRATVKHTDAQLQRFDKGYMSNTLTTYDDKKAYFELFHRLIIDQAKYVFTNRYESTYAGEGDDTAKRMVCKHTLLSDKQMATINSNIPSGIFNCTNGKEVNFVDEWAHDSTRLESFTMKFDPYCGKYDPTRSSDTEYNTFKGYPDFLFDDKLYDDSERNALLVPFFTLVKHLAGCEGYDGKRGLFPADDAEMSEEDQAKYQLFMMVYAFKLQFPMMKLPYVSLVMSGQGTGKNTFADVLGRLFDTDHYICSSSMDDFFGSHAEGFLNKLMVVFNEVNIQDSSKCKSQMKSAVSEATIRVNQKFLQPIDVQNLAAITIFSNESCPVPLDVGGTNRRWIVFKSNMFLAEQWSQMLWTKMHTMWKTEKFLQCLFDHFMGMDAKHFDFAAARKTNSMQKPYKDLVSYFIPAEALFMQDYIEKCMFVDDYTKDKTVPESDRVTPSDTTNFMKHNVFDKPIKVKASTLFAKASTYYVGAKMTVADGKKLMTFNSNLKIHCPRMIMQTVGHESAYFVFTPKDVYIDLIKMGFVVIDEQGRSMQELFHASVAKIEMLGDDLFEYL